jgi:hypothetical protein
MSVTLPAPVQGNIAAGNAFDGDALIAWFAGDALVNDNRREFWGTDAIRAWLDREIIGDTYYFTVRDDRIVRLIIIRNQPTPPWAQH